MNKCRIYTLTFHAADNYGAVWQAYALQQFLIANKIDTACIDYHPRYFNDSLFALSPGPVSTKKILQSIITFPTRLKRKCSFYQFRRQFLKLTSVNNVDLSRATIIVGRYTYFFVIICFGRIIIAINIIKPITACID